MSDSDFVVCGQCGEKYDVNARQNIDPNGTPKCPTCGMPVTLPSTRHITQS